MFLLSLCEVIVMHMTLLYLSHYENVKVKIFNLVNDISKIYLSSPLAINLLTHREYLCVVFWQITSHRILKVDTPTKYEVGTSRKEKHKHKCSGSSICYATSLGEVSLISLLNPLGSCWICSPLMKNQRCHLWLRSQNSTLSNLPWFSFEI